MNKVDDFTTWKVLPEQTAWVIKAHPDNGFESRHKDVGVAVNEAKRLAMDNAPGQVVIHDESGAVKYAVVYQAATDRPEVLGPGGQPVHDREPIAP